MNQSEQTKKVSCSVGILTFNSATALRKCLDSVRDFADIVICEDKRDQIITDVKCAYLIKSAIA